MACSRPSLSAGQQWLKWSYNCLFSNELRLIGRSQSLLIGFSSHEVEPARIKDHPNAYVSLILIPNSCHRLWRRLERCVKALAKSNSLLEAHGSFRCQNSRPTGRRDTGWWASSKWPQAQKVGPDGIALYQYSGSIFCSQFLGLEVDFLRFL